MHEIVLQAPMGPEHGRSGVMSDEQPPVDESECIEHDKEWDVTAHTEEGFGVPKKEPSLSITGASTHTRSATTWTMARLASSLVLGRDWHLLGSVWQIVESGQSGGRTRRSHAVLPRGS